MDPPQRHEDTGLEQINKITERIDFIIADRVVVEVKSVERMNPIFETQVITYLNSRLLKDGVQRIIR